MLMVAAIMAVTVLTTRGRVVIPAVKTIAKTQWAVLVRFDFTINKIILQYQTGLKQ